MMRLITAIALGLTLGACQTLNGLGEDIEDGGEAVQNAAESIDRAL